MKRIWILLLLIAVTGQAHAQDRPNVVVMLADNVGYGDIGAYGAGEIRGMPTPRIDQLASEGLRLTQYLVEPGCTPSRAALMTGRYSQRAGLSTVIIGGTPNTLQASEVTLGELFKSQGYATAIAGKWHLGASEQSWPTRQGFDEYRVGVLETTDGTLYREGMQRAGMPEAAIAAAEPYIWESEANGNLKKVRPYTVEYRRQVEGDIAKASVEFIERQARAKQPFFLYVGFTHTHYPHAVGARVRGKVAHRSVWRCDHGARLPHRPGAGRHQGRRRRGQHDRDLALGQRGRPDGRARPSSAAARTARSAASSAMRWKARSAPSA